MPKATAKTKHIERKPELIELLLTEPINPDNVKGNPVLPMDLKEPIGFAEKFSSLLYETPNIGSTSKKEFFIHGVLGSVLTLPDSGLMEKLGINKVYVKHTMRTELGSDKKVEVVSDVVKLCFSFKKDKKKQIALRVFANDKVTGDGDPGDKYRYSDDELKEIAKKLDVSDVDVDEYVFRISTEGDSDNKSFRLHKEQTGGVKEKFKAAASSQSQINNEFGEVSPQSTNLEDSFESLSARGIEKVTSSTEKIFKEFTSRYQSNKENFSLFKSEAAYHGFHYGALALNFKYRYGLNCYVELIAGNGRADLIFISRTKDASGRVDPKPVPVVIEFKGEGHNADEAIAQIKDKGYLYNLSIRTKAEDAVIVGVAKGGKLKVEKDNIFQSQGFIHRLLEEFDISEIHQQLKNELKNLYHSIKSNERRYLSKLILGQILAADSSSGKYVFRYESSVVGKEVTTFVLNRKGKDVSVILNIIEHTGREHEFDQFGRTRGSKKEGDVFDSNRVPLIDGSKATIKMDITINSEGEFFEAEKTPYCQNVDIGRVSSSQDQKNKYKGRFEKIQSVKINNLVKGLKESSAIKSTTGNEKRSYEKLRESFSPLVEALFPFKGLIEKEVDFQAIMQGLFLNGEIEGGKKIRVFTESNASPQGRMDIALSFTQKPEDGASSIEDDPIILELKLASSDSDANRKLEQAKGQMDRKYEILRSFTDKRTAKRLAIVFNRADENKKNMILASIKDVGVYHTTSGSSPERPYRKRPGSSPAGCPKKRKTRSVGISCIDSRDEESIEEKEGKEELIKKLFDSDEIRKRVKNIEFYDQLFKVYDQISKGETIDPSIKEALIAKFQDIDLNSIDPEIKDIVEKVKEKISRQQINKILKNIFKEPGVAERIEKVAKDAGLDRTAFLTKNNKIQEYIDKINSNPEVMSHLNRVSKISGWAMEGMMYKNLIGDILSDNLEGVAINLGFIAGGPILSKAAEAAFAKGLKLVSEGKVFLGKSLRIASPFLGHFTTGFIVYDLVNQVKAYKAGNKDAMVGIIGDSVVIAVDVAEIGVEVAEITGVLEGVSSITGPIGAGVTAVVFIGTDIYLAVKTVEQEDKIIHLTEWEKFKEGWRALLHIPPEQYIEELIREKEVNNQLVKSGIELLKRNTDIQRYVFPTGKSVVDSCRTIKRRKELCSKGSPINGVCPMGTGIYNTYEHEKCNTKIQPDLEGYVTFSKKIDIFPSEASPNNPEEGELFCFPLKTSPRCNSISIFNLYWGDCQPYNSYYCNSAIGVSYTKDRTGNYTLIALGKGKDVAVGFKDSPNVFLVEDGKKRFFGGDGDDIFVLSGSEITGILNGSSGNNTIDFGGFALGSKSLSINLSSSSINHLRWTDMNNILGREGRQDIIDCCDNNTKYVDGRGGEDEDSMDNISIKYPLSRNDEIQIAVRTYTNIKNVLSQGNFTYVVHQGKGEEFVDIGLEGNHSFIFNYTLQDIRGVSTSKRSVNFTFFLSLSLNSIFIYYFPHINDVFFALSDGTEIRIGNKGGLYALQNTDKQVDEIIRDYPAIANRLNMTIAVQSCNESIIIGHGKHEILYNNPEFNSHLVGNGGENIYMIAPTQKEINIYDVDEESSIDTLNLCNVMKEVQNVLLKVSQSGNDLLIKLEGGESLLKFPIRIKNGTLWYEKLHVVGGSMPMQIKHSGNAWNLSFSPLTFDDNIKIAVITAKDVDEGNKLIVHKQAGQYAFSRLRDDLIIITDPSLGESNACTILLSNFYKEPKMETLSIEFKDITISLQEKMIEINEAVAFCPRVLQINKEFSINNSNLLSHYDCLKFNSDKMLFLKLGNRLLLLSDKGKLLMSNYYSDVDEKWSLPVELNDDIITSEEFRKRAKNASPFRYYQPGKEGLEIYHNQPDNKHQIGLIDLKNKSILDCSEEIIDGDFILSSKGEAIAKVKNWNIYQHARKVMFAFGDAMIYNEKCTISNCNPEDIIEEFKREIAKLINKKDEDGNTLLHHAAMKGDLDKAKLFVEKGADVHEKNNFNMTPLNVAHKFKQKEVAKFLYKERKNEESKQRHRRHHIRHENHHSGHRSPIQEVASSGTRPSSWINDLFGWVKDSVGRLLGSQVALPGTQSLPKESTSNSKPKVTTLKADLSQVDVNGTILLLDTFIRKFTGQKYISSNTRSISEQEALGYTLSIIEKSRKVVEQAALKSGISIHRLNIDFMKMQEEITGKIISGKFNEISEILKSYVEKACPSREAGCSGRLSQKKYDKFMTEFNSIIDPVINQSMQQILSRDSTLKESNVKEQEITLKPKSYLNGTSVQDHLTQDRGLRNQGRDLIP